MAFLKKFVLGFAALALIFAGGTGTQSNNLLMQGGGFIGLLIGLVVLYIFAKMAWRAMGCLPSFFIVGGIIFFILYAIGALNNGIGGIGRHLQQFTGRKETQPQVMIENYDEEDYPVISENFSSQSKKDKTKTEGFNINSFPTIVSSAKIVSGDTLEIQGRYIRLYGLDAPEIDQRCADKQGRSYKCGERAATWLKNWIADYEVTCRVMQNTKEGNMVGTCALGEYDLGAALVNSGWALAYTKYTDIYVPYQRQAQMNERGIWAGDFYTPWDWREIQSKKPKITIVKPKPKRGFLN